MNSENSGIKTQIATASRGNVGKTSVLARVGGHTGRSALDICSSIILSQQMHVG
jgi:hypothetical protein